MTRAGGGRPGHRTVLTALAVGGFGAAVALAGAGSVGTRRHGGSAAADTAVTTVAVLVGIAALGLTALVAQRTRRPPAPAGEPTSPVPAILLHPVILPILATVLMLLFSALVIGPCLSNQRSSDLPRAEPRPSATTVAPSASSTRTPDNRPNWSVVAGFVLGATGLALAVVAARTRRRPEIEAPLTNLDDELAHSLDDLDSLEQDPDHRRVVIRTYARMERALGRAGVARDPSESPQEYLRRALAERGVRADAAKRLTDLFERARFSTHPVDEAMRADAAACLRTIRSEISSGVASSRVSGGTTRAGTA